MAHRPGPEPTAGTARRGPDGDGRLRRDDLPRRPAALSGARPRARAGRCWSARAIVPRVRPMGELGGGGPGRQPRGDGGGHEGDRGDPRRPRAPRAGGGGPPDRRGPHRVGRDDARQPGAAGLVGPRRAAVPRGGRVAPGAVRGPAEPPEARARGGTALRHATGGARGVRRARRAASGCGEGPGIARCGGRTPCRLRRAPAPAVAGGDVRVPPGFAGGSPAFGRPRAGGGRAARGRHAAGRRRPRDA